MKVKLSLEALSKKKSYLFLKLFCSRLLTKLMELCKNYKLGNAFYVTVACKRDFLLAIPFKPYSPERNAAEKTVQSFLRILS